jgi:hypothetical protein
MGNDGAAVKPGERARLACWRWRPAIANFSFPSTRVSRPEKSKFVAARRCNQVRRGAGARASSTRRLLAETSSPNIQYDRRPDHRGDQTSLARRTSRCCPAGLSARRGAKTELSTLAERLVNAQDPVEASRVRETIARGFYGTGRNAWDSGFPSFLILPS